jgi:glutamate transport system permease protein
LDVVLDNLDRYWEGFHTTVSLTLWSFALAAIIGVLVASFRVSPIAPLRWVGTLCVGTIRNTPLPVLFVLFFFGLPKAGVIYSPYVSAVIVLGGYTGMFVAETLRSGVNAVGVGQVEAARSLGFTFPQVLGIVVLPQAVRTVVAPLGSIFIALTKNSSIAYTISVLELTGTADRISTDTAQPIAAFLGAAVGYLILTYPSGLVVGVLERRTAIHR